MDLKGAEIRNFFGIISGKNDINSESINIVTIPHYQRPYRWKSDLVANLILDWHQADSNYFAGSIVTVIKAASNKKTNSFELIDGQQRFTTIYLINYIRFLLYRVIVRECCRSNKLIKSHDDSLRELIDTQKFLLIENDNLLKYKNKIDSFDNDSNEDDDEDYETFFRELANFPINSSENDENYIEEHYIFLKEYLKKSSLILSYDRNFFNDILIEVLSSVCIKISDRKKPELFINDLDTSILESGGETYKTAIETIFHTFCETIDDNENKNSFIYARALSKKITDFLKQIQICVIETGNPDDAYTLFETLNERSLALDNLDLIKNQFFKTLVESNNSISNSQKDDFIQELDDFWNEEIFKNTGIKEKSLITFLAIAYITGNTKITPKQTDKNIRDALKTHLSKYTLSNPYTIDLARYYFKIFKVCKIFLEKASIKYSSEANVAYENFYQNNTILEKCIHFLRGLNQDTVLAGLFAVILNYIRYNEKSNNFDPNEIKKISEEYLKNNNLPIDIKNTAFDLWKLSMKSKNHQNVLKHSSELLEKNNLQSPSFQIIRIDSNIASKLDDEFKESLQTWSYGQNYKIRILFARCFQLNKDSQGKLVNSPFSFTTKEKLDIDHMEPKIIDVSHQDCYFQHPDRNSFINQLGNMMILTSNSNRQKSNKPMMEVLPVLKNIGLSNHFITITTETLLDENHNLSGNKKVKVPNENFFNQRKQFLIDTFSEAIEVPFS